MDLQYDEDFEDFRNHILPRTCDYAMFFCGSFYEQPLEYAMLNLTDVDHMIFDRSVIASTKGQDIPRNFYGEMLTIDTTKCHLGFARLLRRREEKTECIILSRKSLHGPAIRSCLVTWTEVSDIFNAALKYRPNLKAFSEMTTDLVFSILCPHWPPEAAEWIIRKRSSHLPTKDLIEKIVAGGCHLVPKSHKSNPNDETSWRFSFSQAELILLSSWSEVQKYVYHILRLLKSDVVAKCGGENKTFLCTYHFKTLMLWACEEKPSDFWYEDRIESAIEELLLQMIQWVIEKKCPNYFIRRNNMLDFLQGDFDVSNEVSLLHDALQLFTKAIALQPMIYRGKVFRVLVSDKALLLAQLALNRRFFTNALDQNCGRNVVEKLSSSPLLSHEVEHLFRAIQLHRLMASDMYSSEAKFSEGRQTYESDALNYFKLSYDKNLTSDNSYYVCISSLDSFLCTMDKVLNGTSGEHRQRVCCYRRIDGGNWTKEAMEALCQTLISAIDSNHHNPSYFISAAYYANFCYTCLRDYRQALKICEEALSLFRRLEATVGLNTFEAAFSDEILCIFINRHYIHIFDEGIQVIFGFLTLHTNYIKRIEKHELYQRLLMHEFILQVCPVGFLRYIKIRCKSKLHLSKGDCFEDLNILYDNFYDGDTALRKQSNAAFFAALCIKL